MRRPVPTYARGGKRIDASRDETSAPRAHVLACPRRCPKWEFDAWRALIKPQFKVAIAHRSPEQLWPDDADAIVKELRLPNRIRVDRAGADHHLRLTFARRDLKLARQMAVELSRRIPDLWFTYDRQLLRAGVFYRYRRGIRPEIVPVKTSPLRYKRLPRDVYLAMHGRSEQD